MLKAEVQMAEEKKAEKEVLWHFTESQWAECSNGRNWPNPEQVDLPSRSFQSTCSDFGQFHRGIVGLRKDFFPRKITFFMNLNFFESF
jgi:hypothetical protein